MAEITYLTQGEAAKLLRLSSRTLERQRLDGTGPLFVKAGRRVIYRVVDLEQWAADRTYRSTSEVDAAVSKSGANGGAAIPIPPPPNRTP